LFGRKGSSVLGVDIGSSSIKIVQLKKESGAAVLETYGELSLGPYNNINIGQATNLPSEKLAEALMDLLKESGVTSKSAGFSIPFSSSLLTFIELPTVNTKQLNKMIPIEARKYIPVPISEVVLDWFIIPEDEKSMSKNNENKTTKVLLVAIHNEVLSNYNSIVDVSGLETDFFEIEIFSAIRSVLDQRVAPQMIIDIGAATTKVYVVEMGIVRVSHIINRGSQDVTMGISKSLKMSIAKAEELKRSEGLLDATPDVKKVSLLTLDYIFSDANRVLLNYQKKNAKNVGQIILTGGGSVMKGVKDLALNHLETEVILGDPFAKVSTPAFLENVLKESGSEFSVAVGLALRKLQDFDL
jgi:type IV pilus assembly protein PilM